MESSQAAVRAGIIARLVGIGSGEGRVVKINHARERSERRPAGRGVGRVIVLDTASRRAREPFLHPIDYSLIHDAFGGILDRPVNEFEHAARRFSDRRFKAGDFGDGGHQSMRIDDRFQFMIECGESPGAARRGGKLNPPAVGPEEGPIIGTAERVGGGEALDSIGDAGTGPENVRSLRGAGGKPEAASIGIVHNVFVRDSEVFPIAWTWNRTGLGRPLVVMTPGAGVTELERVGRRIGHREAAVHGADENERVD